MHGGLIPRADVQISPEGREKQLKNSDRWAIMADLGFNHGPGFQRQQLQV